MVSRQREWQRAHPEADRAHQRVNSALKTGRLTKQPCSKCGSVKGVEAHHEDYNQPLTVTWLCGPCHQSLHVANRATKTLQTFVHEVLSQRPSLPFEALANEVLNQRPSLHLSQVQCVRCGYAWLPRSPYPPKHCPNCKSANWAKHRGQTDTSLPTS